MVFLIDFVYTFATVCLFLCNHTQYLTCAAFTCVHFPAVGAEDDVCVFCSIRELIRVYPLFGGSKAVSGVTLGNSDWIYFQSQKWFIMFPVWCICNAVSPLLSSYFHLSLQVAISIFSGKLSAMF